MPLPVVDVHADPLLPMHRRHADRTVQLWMQRLKDSSSTKRLSLVYLANGMFQFPHGCLVSRGHESHMSIRITDLSCFPEVVQQSRIRHKEDFVIAFSPVVAEATSVAYKGAPAEIQAKLRRVIDVWKDRSIFEGPIQAAIESRLDGMRAQRMLLETELIKLSTQNSTNREAQRSLGFLLPRLGAALPFRRSLCR